LNRYGEKPLAHNPETPSAPCRARDSGCSCYRSAFTRTFVVADRDDRVCGYYAMAAGAVSHRPATSSVRRNMPDPVPVMVLARLALDRREQGRDLGAALLQDAVNRAVAVSQNAGVRALLAHALHENAGQFYEHYGFQPSPVHPMTLMLRLNGGNT
jgi:GNAT superfamily N-acetyltransferase